MSDFAAVDIAVVGPDPLWVVDNMNRLHNEIPGSVVRDYVTILEAIDDLEPGHPAVLLLAPEVSSMAVPVVGGLEIDRPEVAVVATIAPGNVEPEIVRHIRMGTETSSGYPVPDADDHDAVVATVQAALRDRQEAAPTASAPIEATIRYSTRDENVVHARAIAHGLGSESQLVTVTAGKGGAGTTTVAINLAAAFVREGGRAIVIDAHGATGDLGLLLGLAPHDHDDLVDLEINADTIRYFVSKDDATDIEALVLPTADDDLTRMGTTLLIDALVALDGSADLVVVDAPADLVHAAQLHRYSRQVIVVTSPELASIKDTRVVVGALAKSDVERLAIVVNHPTDRRLRTTADDIARTIGIPVVADLPFDDHLADVEHPVTVPPARSGFGHAIEGLVGQLEIPRA